MNDVTRVTDADLAWWQELAPTLDWVYAVTYAEGAPHEYVTNGRTEGLSAEDYVRAARVVRTFGEPGKFFKFTNVYLESADGWKWWGMSPEDVTNSGIINRARVEHIYGTQNAPRTRSGIRSPYDEVASDWDRSLGATEDERGALTALARSLGVYRKGRVLDIGCGTGLALDLKLTESVRYVGIDPSTAMLNELVLKYPYLAGVHPMRFADAIERRVLGGTRFDLVVALGGSASYLSPADFAAVKDHAMGPVLLTVYADGEAPQTADLDERDLVVARESLRDLAAESGGAITESAGSTHWPWT